MEPAEIEFLAEDELIDIIPNFTHPQLNLVANEIGPFSPNLPTKVPLWIAIYLKEKQKCTIIAPGWMSIENLKLLKQNEMDSPVFVEMPSEHYKEIVHSLSYYCGMDIKDIDEIKTLIKDIWDIRMSKLRASTDLFIRSDSDHARVNQLTRMEINYIRSLLMEGLDLSMKLKHCSD
ncbi:hypothetical protein SNEBB_011463 [Seison nebaliae]|nr:hypothetical protein SNEBB_011463 [Seison nebaliae]